MGNDNESFYERRPRNIACSFRFCRIVVQLPCTSLPQLLYPLNVVVARDQDGKKMLSAHTFQLFVYLVLSTGTHTPDGADLCSGKCMNSKRKRISRERNNLPHFPPCHVKCNAQRYKCNGDGGPLFHSIMLKQYLWLRTGWKVVLDVVVCVE